MTLRTSHLRFTVTAFVLTLILSLPSTYCAKAPPEFTPEQTILYHANEVVVGLGTAQRAAIELNTIQNCTSATPPVCTPLLSTANTGIVVDAVTDALSTIRSVPDGWRATADAAIVRIQARLDAAGQTQLRPYLEAVRIIIKGGGQ